MEDTSNKNSASEGCSSKFFYLSIALNSALFVVFCVAIINGPAPAQTSPQPDYEQIAKTISDKLKEQGPPTAVASTTDAFSTELANLQAQLGEIGRQLQAISDSSVTPPTEGRKRGVDPDLITKEIDSIQAILKNVEADHVALRELMNNNIASRQTQLVNTQQEIKTLHADLDKVSATLREVTEKNITANRTEIANMQQDLKTLREWLEMRLSTLQPDKNAIAKEYYEAAQKQTDSAIARMLYYSALAYSTDKKAILDEVTAKTKEWVKLALKNNKLESAEEHLTQLSALYASALSSGSVKDITDTPELYENLAEIGRIINEYADMPIREKRNRLALIKGKVEQLGGNSTEEKIAQFTQATKLLNELEDDTWPGDLEAEADQLKTAIRNKQAFLIPSKGDELVLPSILGDSNEAEQNTECETWLNHFATILREEKISADLRVEFLSDASAFLEKVQELDDEKIKASLKNVENAISDLNILHWKIEVDQEITSLKDNPAIAADYKSVEGQDKKDATKNTNVMRLAILTSLLRESESFKEDIKNSELVKGRIIELNREILALNIAELEKDMPIIKKLSESEIGKSNDELILQLVSAKQSMYLQLLTQLVDLNTQYPDSFTSEIGCVSQTVKGLCKWQDSLKDSVSASMVVKYAQKHEAYKKWAEQMLESAEGHYNKAVTFAKEWLITWGSDEAQNCLKEGIVILYKIHPDDLHQVSPKLKDRYDDLMSKIKEHLHKDKTPNPMGTEYKRIEDMRTEEQTEDVKTPKHMNKEEIPTYEYYNPEDFNTDIDQIYIIKV